MVAQLGRCTVRMLLASALMTVLLTFGCSTGSTSVAHRPSPRASTTPDAGSRIDTLLEQRSQALLDDDAPGFLAAVDPSRSVLVAHEQMVFANLRQIRFASLRYQRLAPDAPVELRAGVPTVVDVALVLAVAGVQRAPTAIGYTYAVEPAAPGLKIVDIMSKALGELRTNVPWDLDPLSVVRSGRVILAADSSVSNASELASHASAAVDHVRKTWGQRTAPSDVLVFVTRSDDTVRRWFASAQVDDGLTFTLLEVDQRAHAIEQFAGAWVVLRYPLASNPDYPNGADPNRFEAIARHELTHAITVEVQNVNRPSWALEGYANWVARGDDPNELRAIGYYVHQAVSQGKDVGQLAVTHQDFVADAGLNYVLGESVYRFVADQWGRDRATDLYVAVIGGTPFNDVTRSMFGLSGDDFLSRWRAYVRALA